LKIDKTKAEKLPGVKDIVTHEDTKEIPPYVLAGGAFGGQPKSVLNDVVRFVGAPVAVVAAESEKIAEEALKLIEVEYERLPAVFDPEEAMKPEAPKVYPEGNIALSLQKTQSHVLASGDVEKGLKEADFVFEDKYKTPRQAHCTLEPYACVASFEAGKLTVWLSTNFPHSHQASIAQGLKMPIHSVRVIVPYIGGSFGGRGQMIFEGIITSFISRRVGRPVKLEYSREECFYATYTRWPHIFELKTGVNKDGTLVARQARMIVDTGIAEVITACNIYVMAAFWASLYKAASIRFEGYNVYTNNPAGGPMRGIGNPPLHLAMECQMDEIAEKLGLDPVDIRLKNCVQADETTAAGCVIRSCGLKECIEKGAERIGWRERRKKPGEVGDVEKRGMGMACFIHCSGLSMPADLSSATLTINLDGTVNLLHASPNMGQGINTVLAQIVAEELGVRYEDIVQSSTADTLIAPWDIGDHGSRQTVMMGNAVRLAAADAKQQLLEAAAAMLNVSKDQLEAKDGNIYVKDSPEKAVPIAQVYLFSLFALRRIVIGRGSYDPGIEGVVPDYPTTKIGDLTSCYPFGANFVEVEVNTQNGKVKVLKVVAAHDVGRALNPNCAEGQIEGGVVMGIGFALTENYLQDENGRMVNPNLREYKLPKARDIPEIEAIMVESVDPIGPYGAKGLGETATVATPAAIVNAIYNAIGIRFKELPITPSKILEALEKKRRAI